MSLWHEACSPLVVALPSAAERARRLQRSRFISQTTLQSPFIRWFAEINLDDIPLVGGKNASLGEMYRALAAQGVHVPNGYAITAEAYRAFLRQSNLEQ